MPLDKIIAQAQEKARAQIGHNSMATFKDVLDAIRASDQSQWDIGDKVLECVPIGDSGINDGGGERLEALASYLAQHGFTSYTASYLRQMRRISANFPSGSRRTTLSYSVHRLAGDPQRLKALVAATPEGRKLNDDIAQTINREWREKESKVVDAKKEKAKEKLEAAMAAGNQEGAKEARAELNSTRMPKPSEGYETPPPPPGEIADALLSDKIEGTALQAIVAIEKHLENLKAIQKLHPDHLGAIAERYRELADRANRLADAVMPKAKSQTQLKVV